VRKLLKAMAIAGKHFCALRAKSEEVYEKKRVDVCIGTCEGDTKTKGHPSFQRSTTK